MGVTVLIIEDDPQNLYLAGYLLESAGFDVVRAQDGLSGVEMAANSEPDIVLVDILLPGIDGYEATRRIRSLPGLAEVPIVALTAYSMSGDKDAALAAGCDGYISKPIDPSGFATRVKAFLGEEQAGASSAGAPSAAEDPR